MQTRPFFKRVGIALGLIAATIPPINSVDEFPLSPIDPEDPYKRSHNSGTKRARSYSKSKPHGQPGRRSYNKQTQGLCGF